MRVPVASPPPLATAPAVSSTTVEYSDSSESDPPSVFHGLRNTYVQQCNNSRILPVSHDDDDDGCGYADDDEDDGDGGDDDDDVDDDHDGDKGNAGKNVFSIGFV